MRCAAVAFLIVVCSSIASARTDASIELTTVICNADRAEDVQLRSTDRLPGASGNARVERMGGTTTIEVELYSIKPASLFGGDYNTYVLWVVPPGGPAENAGEIAVEGSRGTLKSTTAAPEFAILISAEPHYLASIPSAFVVFQNEAAAEARMIRQPLAQGVYNFQRSTLDRVKEAKGHVHSDIRQAFTAFRLAQRAGSRTLAPEEFAKAECALRATLNLWQKHTERPEIAVQARETVRLAVAAQRLAEERARQGTRHVTEGGEGEVTRPSGARCEVQGRSGG